MTQVHGKASAVFPAAVTLSVHLPAAVSPVSEVKFLISGGGNDCFRLHVDVSDHSDAQVPSCRRDSSKNVWKIKKKKKKSPALELFFGRALNISIFFFFGNLI